MENKCNEKVKELVVTTPFNLDEYIQDLLISYSKVYFIPKPIISLYIPFKPGLRVRTTFNILVIVKLLKMPTRAGILHFGNLGQESTGMAIRYLVDLGLIRKCGKPRLIKPFQKIKVDTGYTITVKGENVIRRILNHEFILKNKKSEKNT